MVDQAHLDLKYFIDSEVYNCPFCNRRNVQYNVESKVEFDWTTNKRCVVWRVKCASCQKISMHLTFEDLQSERHGYVHFKDNVEIDDAIFYSVPSSFFVIDSRIPTVIRELITEAEGCLKMNFLTGASACTRKAIYELLAKENATGKTYDERLRSLKKLHPEIDPELIDVLGDIKDMTSDSVHEGSWDEWDSQHLKLFLETLRTILHELYVVPDERKRRKSAVQKLKAVISSAKGSKRPEK